MVVKACTALHHEINAEVAAYLIVHATGTIAWISKLSRQQPRPACIFAQPTVAREEPPAAPAMVVVKTWQHEMLT